MSPIGIVNNNFPCCNRGGRLKAELGVQERKCKCQGAKRVWDVTVEKSEVVSARMKGEIWRAVWNERVDAKR
jgi:hypothetical protein